MGERVLRMIDANFTDKTSVNGVLLKTAREWLLCHGRCQSFVRLSIMETFLRIFGLLVDIANRANTAAAGILGIFGIFR